MGEFAFQTNSHIRSKKSRRSFPKKLEEAAIRQKGEEGGKEEEEEEEEEAAKLAQEEELGNQIFVSNSKIEAKKSFCSL